MAGGLILIAPYRASGHDHRVQACRIITADWRDPLDVLAPFAREPFAIAMLSDGGGQGRWSYLARRPVATFASGADAKTALNALGGSGGAQARAAAINGPPFQGGVAGLAGYEWGATLEPSAPQERTARWPDFTAGLYDAVLAFDHASRQVLAVGRGRTEVQAERAAARALADLAPSGAQASHDLDRCEGPLAELCEIGDAANYQAAVAAVVEAIKAGEIFQANIARRWDGRLRGGADPFAVIAALHRRTPAPFAAYLRLPALALVSNSPERFIQATRHGCAQSQPIKGTRPRGDDPMQDAALAAELVASVKDRAENLMIVDLMRNDLARTCRPGSVRAPQFCTLESFSHVHHLVSTVTGALRDGETALDLFAAAFPPGSITGAPKLQAMQVIARHEAPRGPFFGSLFWAGLDGGFDSSVLIRTLAFEADDGGWRVEGRAGAGITADSDPAAENAETLAKFAALRTALTGG